MQFWFELFIILPKNKQLLTINKQRLEQHTLNLQFTPDQHNNKHNKHTHTNAKNSPKNKLKHIKLSNNSLFNTINNKILNIIIAITININISRNIINTIERIPKQFNYPMIVFLIVDQTTWWVS